MNAASSNRSNNQVLLRLEHVEKTFPNGTVALRGVDLEVERGSVHGLLGANGAGKSTLIKILSGDYPASAGRVIWRGQQVDWHAPGDAQANGVATIHQHIPLVPSLSVIENVFLGAAGRWRDTQGNRQHFARLLETVGYHIDPDILVQDLSIGQRQMVAILQSLSRGAELVVMDEPTASLASEERELVYRTIRRLTEREGKSILFVSHFLDEIVALTDRVTVLRDGVAVMRAQTRDIDEASIAEAIVGREIVKVKFEDEGEPVRSGTPVVELRDLQIPGKLVPVSLSVHAGEVLGVAGFLGSGRSELLHAIFGADAHARGEVLINGQPLARSPVAAVKAGVALVPEDRMHQGLIPMFEIWRNTTLPDLNSVTSVPFILDTAAELARAEDGIAQLRIKADSPEILVSELSGGNAQKVTFAKWMFSDIKLFLLDEPTAGIDVGAKADILSLSRRLAAAGAAVIIVSSEFEELITVSDRILVMRQGKVIAERKARETSEHELILMAAGNADAASAVTSADTPTHA